MARHDVIIVAQKYQLGKKMLKVMLGVAGVLLGRAYLKKYRQQNIEQDNLAKSLLGTGRDPGTKEWSDAFNRNALQWRTADVKFRAWEYVSIQYHVTDDDFNTYMKGLYDNTIIIKDIMVDDEWRTMSVTRYEDQIIRDKYKGDGMKFRKVKYIIFDQMARNAKRRYDETPLYPTDNDRNIDCT